jgi:prepilin-type N-terminal cleavage/methylation domain-containing protein/prepilin-type processing-associated H-X9-DG protein
MHRFRDGFTLLELLVVVTIIVVLLALLAPALDSAIKSAERTHCLANLDAMGVAIGQFTNDKKSRYPQYDAWNHLVGSRAQSDFYGDGSATADPFFSSTKNRPLNAYLGYDSEDAIVRVAECPQDLGDSIQGPLGQPGFSNAYIAYGTSYLGAWGGNWFRVQNAFGIGPSTTEPVNSMKSTQAKPTHTKLLVADWMWHANRRWEQAQTRWHDDPLPGEADAGTHDPDAIRKHNALFADGHAEFFAKIEVRELEQPYVANGQDPPPNPSWKWW